MFLVTVEYKTRDVQVTVKDTELNINTTRLWKDGSIYKNKFWLEKNRLELSCLKFLVSIILRTMHAECRLFSYEIISSLHKTQKQTVLSFTYKCKCYRPRLFFEQWAKISNINFLRVHLNALSQMTEILK